MSALAGTGAVGKQLNSNRKTLPCYSFSSCSRAEVKHLRPSASDVRAREICLHPASAYPGPPLLFAPAYKQTEFAPSCVAKDFGSDRRFLEDSCFQQSGAAIIKHSTHASVFSTTYPYQEPARPEQSAINAETPSPTQGGKPSPRAAGGNSGRAACTDPDLNLQQMRFSKLPSYSFGSGGMGNRFVPGTNFSKAPVVPTSSPRLGFRKMRDSLPEAPATVKDKGNSEDAAG